MFITVSLFRLKIEDPKGYKEGYLSDQLIFSVSRNVFVTFLRINEFQRDSIRDVAL